MSPPSHAESHPASPPALHTPRFGQLALWALLLGSLYFVVKLEDIVVMASTPRLATAASLLFWLPDRVVTSDTLFDASVAAYLLFVGGWVLRVGLPWCSWGAAGAFTLMGALAVENLPGGGHAFHATTMLLWVHAAWEHSRRHDIRAALREGRFWTTPLYPRWVAATCLFYLVFFHAAAGFTKLAFSGLDWPDGVTLQLWAYERGRPTLPRIPVANPLSQLLVSHPSIARLAAVGVLSLEVGTLLSLFSRRLRTLFGLGLLGFYAVNFVTFDFGAMFLPNACLTALFFLPVGAWSDRLAGGFVRRRRGCFASPRGAGPVARAGRFLIGRFDAFGWFTPRADSG